MTAARTLREHAGEYLAMRRALGFSLTTFGRRLDSFITWLEQAGATVITSDAAIAWATATPTAPTRHTWPGGWTSRGSSPGTCRSWTWRPRSPRWTCCHGVTGGSPLTFTLPARSPRS